jgi:hypothetical protein
MIKYEAASVDVQQTIEKLINMFPQKFIHINVSDMHLTFKDAPTSPWKARVRILSGFYSSLTNKKIGIEVWKQEWINADAAHKAAILYHELTHIMYDIEKQVYKLKQHDVQDFYELLQNFGLNYEKVEEVFASLTK